MTKQLSRTDGVGGGVGHTPGPWRAVVRSNQKGIRNVAVDLPPRGAWFPSATAAFTKEDVANARLIAAAPDLLAACKTALRHLCDTDACHEGKLVRAAIAKAEGRTP